MNMRNDGRTVGGRGGGSRGAANEEGAERGKFLCGPVSLPPSSPPSASPLCSSPFDFSAPSSSRRAGPRFKYQRRLKSDLYHAESCYLYRFIRDLLARYAEGGILAQHRVDRGANIVQDKGSQQGREHEREEEEGEEREEVHSSLGHPM